MPRPPKKSDTLEIRIPHATKAAFMSRCQADGANASETVRAFIDDHLAARSRANDKRTWVRWAAGLAAALGLGATALPTLARPLERAGFDQLDRDGSGALSIPEFADGADVSLRVDAGGGLPAVGGRFNLDPADPDDRALRRVILRRAFLRRERNCDGGLSFDEFRGR